jgi:hypothetical protein
MCPDILICSLVRDRLRPQMRFAVGTIGISGPSCAQSPIVAHSTDAQIGLARIRQQVIVNRVQSGPFTITPFDGATCSRLDLIPIGTLHLRARVVSHRSSSDARSATNIRATLRSRSG